MKVLHKTFPGGYRFNLEGKPQDRVIECELPSKVFIPLKQGFGGAVRPLVKVGEEVKAGQIIGLDDHSISSPVHASINGKVEAMTKLAYPQEDINTVVIKADGTAGWQPLAGYNPDWRRLSREKIERLLYSAGVTALDGKGIPTGFKTSVISSHEVKDLIIEGVEDSPYHLSLPVLLAGERYDHFIEGIKILKKIMPQAEMHLAINSERRQLVQELALSTAGLERLSLYSLPPKYPQGNDRVLARTILGGRANDPTAAKGLTVLTAATLLQIHDAVVKRKPLIERMVALSGPGWQENANLMVRIGTPVDTIAGSYLRRAADYRLIPNNLLTDETLNARCLPVDRCLTNLAAVPGNTKRRRFAFLRSGRSTYSRAFLPALNRSAEQSCDTGMHGETRPCLFCGYCEEVCPAGIIPHLLDKRVKRNYINEELIRYGILDCVDCNLCTFVCPSKIPVARHISLGRQKLTADHLKEAEVKPEEEMAG